MKAKKAIVQNPADSSKTVKEKVNPFTKLMDDKYRIATAVNKNQPLSSLKDIKFVQPL